MSSFGDHLLNVCLYKIKHNQLALFYMMFNGGEYLIIFKNYENIDFNFDANEIYNGDCTDHPIIYANLNRLKRHMR